VPETTLTGWNVKLNFVKSGTLSHVQILVLVELVTHVKQAAAAGESARLYRCQLSQDYTAIAKARLHPLL